MESMMKVIKELMLYALLGIVYGGIFLLFLRLLMAVSI